MNFGHGELGFSAWPRAKSRPVAEYCTVFRVLTPIAVEASPITFLASCADAIQTSITASASPARHVLNIVPPPFTANCTLETGSDHGGRGGTEENPVPSPPRRRSRCPRRRRPSTLPGTTLSAVLSVP